MNTPVPLRSGHSTGILVLVAAISALVAAGATIAAMQIDPDDIPGLPEARDAALKIRRSDEEPPVPTQP